MPPLAGLRSFRPDAEHNPGRMNFFSRDDVSVVVDLAHNEAGPGGAAWLGPVLEAARAGGAYVGGLAAALADWRPG